MGNCDLSHMRITIWLSFTTLALVIVFATFPSIDLVVASWFFDSTSGLWLGTSALPESIRSLLRKGTEFAALLTFIVFLGNIRLGALQRTGWRVWAFLWGPVFLCAGVLVNGVLKSQIGRARPYSVSEFGGQSLFTPPFQFTGQCYSNCSFSSGEVALIASFAIPVCVLLWHRQGLFGRLACAIVATGAVILMAVLRMAAGGHFLSDVVMSVFFSALTTLFLYRALNIAAQRQLLSGAAVAADMTSLWRNGRHATIALALRWWPKIKAVAIRWQRSSDAHEAQRKTESVSPL